MISSKRKREPEEFKDLLVETEKESQKWLGKCCCVEVLDRMTYSRAAINVDGQTVIESSGVTGTESLKNLRDTLRRTIAFVWVSEQIKNRLPKILKTEPGKKKRK